MADGDEIPDRILVRALEFAVGVAAAGARQRPALPFPTELKPFLKLAKLPVRALRDVRRAIEDDMSFREALAAVATPELLDEAGMLWLTRPPGWQQQLLDMVDADPDSGAVDAAAELRRTDRRRAAAEQAARRAALEVSSLRAELDRVRQLLEHVEAEAADLRRARDELHALSADQQEQLRRAADAVAVAHSRLAAEQANSLAADQRAALAEHARDTLLADRAIARVEPAEETPAHVVLAGAAQVASDLAQHAEQIRAMADELGRLAGHVGSLEPATVPVTTAAGHDRVRRGRRTHRKPLALPGGIYGSSTAAAEFLVRHPGVCVLVDGYNVAKLAWPRLQLEQQREQCIEACEDVARRYGTRIAVVFDGSSIAGASAVGRRLVRVRFSPEGVTADDVLREEVAAIAALTPVVVVTNDRAVANDARAMGANTLSSEQWLELARR